MLNEGQFSGPYSQWGEDPAFANTRRYSGSLADAPAFPDRKVEGKWTTAKANAIDEAKAEWRQEFGPRTPTGGVHPNSLKRKKSGTIVPYDRDFLRNQSGPAKVGELDPRMLHGIQPGVHTQGVEYYLGDQYRRSGQTFEQLKGNAPTEANRMPTVYRREDGMNVLLSGHHRAAAALSQDRGLLTRIIEGPVPPHIRR